jgi:hypothetical protein
MLNPGSNKRIRRWLLADVLLLAAAVVCVAIAPENDAGELGVVGTVVAGALVVASIACLIIPVKVLLAEGRAKQ